MIISYKQKRPGAERESNSYQMKWILTSQSIAIDHVSHSHAARRYNVALCNAVRIRPTLHSCVAACTSRRVATLGGPEYGERAIIMQPGVPRKTVGPPASAIRD